MHEPEPQYPRRLAEAMRGIGRPAPAVPEAVDRQVLADARAQLARQRWRRRAWGVIGAVAAAAIVLLALRVAIPPVEPSQPAAPLAQAKDINGDGVVDMLDAYALARRIERDAPSQAAWDFTRDGVVDDADVRAVAAAAVQLDPRAPGEGAVR